MPQMAPIWWSLLYLMFISSFILTIKMMYFNSPLSPKMKMEKKIILGNFNFKW